MLVFFPAEFAFSCSFGKVVLAFLHKVGTKTDPLFFVFSSSADYLLAQVAACFQTETDMGVRGVEGGRGQRYSPLDSGLHIVRCGGDRSRSEFSLPVCVL